MTPFFSIITVHFNQLQALKLTVGKMREQEGMGTVFEHIVVDGNSTDGTPEYLGGLTSNPAFHFISEKDNGIYDAMNKGIALAAGRYVFFINAGDYFAHTTLLIGLQKGLRDEAAVYGDTLIDYGNFKRTSKARPLEDIWKSLPFIHQSICVRKDLLVSHPFDLKYKFCADYEQLCAIIKTQPAVVYNPSELSVVQAGGASDKGRIKAIKEVFEISQRNFRINRSQRWYFRKELVKARFVLLLKKILPEKWTGKLTRLKYAEE